MFASYVSEASPGYIYVLGVCNRAYEHEHMYLQTLTRSNLLKSHDLLHILCIIAHSVQ